jgi:transcriptional regulator with XRE-family HTH domain
VNTAQQTIYLKKLGNNIRRIRREKGYSMEALCNQFDMDYKQLGRIERGEINTSVIGLLKIATSLGVDMEDLFKFKK